jgi:hypothetical protein
MKTAQSAVQQVYEKVKTLDQRFKDYFALDEDALRKYSGSWQELLKAQITLELKNDYICSGVNNDRFQMLRKIVMAFQELPEVKQPVHPEPTPNPKG